MDGLYFPAYMLASDFVHGGLATLGSYLVDDGGSTWVRTGGTNEALLDEVLMISSISVLMVVSEFCRAFEIGDMAGSDAVIERLNGHAREAIPRLRHHAWTPDDPTA